MDDSMGDGFSLADLAGIDTSGIDEVRFEEYPPFVADWEVVKASLAEGEDREDQHRIFMVEMEFKTLEVLTILAPGHDKESLTGKIFKRNFRIDPQKSEEEVKTAIGRFLGFAVDIGGEKREKLAETVEGLNGLTFRAPYKTRKVDGRTFGNIEPEAKKKR